MNDCVKMKRDFIELIHKNEGILQRICNYGNPYKEDYYQEILIRLWKAFPSFNQQSAFSTWLYRVAFNTAIDIIRKEVIRPLSVELRKEMYSAFDSDQNIESEQRDMLYQAINGLSEIDKATILLYLEEYDYKEISTVIGISENYVGVKINRIKKELHKKMNNGKG